MSRIGNKHLTAPAGVKIELQPHVVTVSGPKGKLEVLIPEGITVEVKDHHYEIHRDHDEKHLRQQHGTTRALIHNAIVGVSQGYKKQLEIIGIGYKAAVDQQGNLKLNIGYSHEIVVEPRPGVKITAPEATKVIVEGIDRQAVGETAAVIRSKRKPEPYLGKGIRYLGEKIIRKLGKRAAKK